jgi:uncharacterized sporulation protein YeaH/YhbH (DUF444 family)
MPRRIEEDHKAFRDVYGSKIRKALKKFINNGTIFRTRPDGSKVPISIPRMDIPIVVHGDNNKGSGRGDGKDGDIIKKGNKGDKGNKAGTEGADGIIVSIDMDEILNFMKDDLELPDLLPKPNEVLEEENIKYNDISKTGPESLRHNRRTMLQALKRTAASGEVNKEHLIPGFDVPVKMITPINADKRYRQYKIIKKPSSNAVIFFARDGSASMDQTKCDIVSDMAWWIDIWIRKFYKRVESCYIWHDVDAQEVDQQKFYRYRYGGGTICSSALDLISKQFENRYPPDKWNIYVMYFTDGENGENNDVFIKLLRDKFNKNIVNLVAITQILAYPSINNLKESVDKILEKDDNVVTTEIGNANEILSEEERDKLVRKSIIKILGKKNV